MSLFSDALAASAGTDAGMTIGDADAAAEVRTTWAEVHARARSVAAVLADRGIRPGDAVAVLAAAPDVIAPAVQAVWLAGGSVTMLHQPTARTDLTRYARETARVLAVIGARAVIVGDPFTGAAETLAVAGVPVLLAEELATEGTEFSASGATTDLPDIAESATALLQLTSGSTASPKAVRITHRNLWTNIDAMCTAADLRSGRDVMVSWLPLFHDMGMVGFLTLPMCRGIEVVMVTPSDFLRAPLLWLELISRHHGTCTAAPNFAYAVTAKVLARLEPSFGEGAGLDLASLRFALNGAEPIDVTAAEAFLSAGARFGLRETAMVCAYGMAEATLGVSFHPWGTPLEVDTVEAAALETDRRAVPVPVPQTGVPVEADEGADTPVREPHLRRFPVLGPPLPGVEVVARTDAGEDLGDREVGTLFLRGDSVTDEYLTIDGSEPTRGADGWLDTGDLGYLTDGAVVVCGRVKDVIIMGGRNIHPTDIERVAQTVPGVRPGNAAAVRWETGAGRESFAVAVESRESADDVAVQRIQTAVRSAVTAEIGVRPARVSVLTVGSLPKTPSGKIKRAATAALLRGSG